MLKKKVMSWILIFTLAFVLAIGKPNLEAKAAGEAAVIASMFAAMPVSWPLLAGLLIAGGIGTAIYWNSVEDTVKADLVIGATAALQNAGQTLYDLAGDAKEYMIDTARSYIKGAIVNDKTYVDEATLNTIWDWAKTNDLLGGDDLSIGTDFQYTRTQALNVGDSLANAYDFTSFVTYVTTVMAGISGYEAITKKISAAYAYAIANYSFNYLRFDISKASISVNVCTSNSTVKNISQDAGYVYTMNSRVNLRYFRYNLDDTITNEDRNPYSDSLYQNTISNPYNGECKFTSIGNWSIENNGVPEGEKGQVMENDGAWSNPWDADSKVNIDSYGDSYPVTVPHSADWTNSINNPAATWDADTAQPAISLPEVIPDVIPGDIPIDFDQDIAQEGTADIPKPIVIESPVIPAVGQFLVPDWIKDKYPFCIPFDIVRCVSLFQNPGRAPRWEYVFRWGNQSYTFVLDLGDPMFTVALQTVRYGLLLVMCAWVISHSKNLVEGK